jgi:hypothetical protein
VPVTTIKCEHGPMTVKLDKELYSCLVHGITWSTITVLLAMNVSEKDPVLV